MPHLSHSSFRSSEDKNGFCHTLSIDPKACQRQNEIAVYVGKARSSGGLYDCRDGSIVHAKFTENKSVASNRWAETEVKKTEIAQDAAEKFNKTLQHLKKVLDSTSSHSSGKKRFETDLNSCNEVSQRIEFQIPQTAELDSISFIDRSRRKNETFLILQTFSTYRRFIDTSVKTQGSSKDSDSKSTKHLKRSKSFSSSRKTLRRSKKIDAFLRPRSISEGDKDNFSQFISERLSEEIVTDDTPTMYLHAFMHHFFCYHNGEMAIDCLKGEYSEESGYTLTVPVIHSRLNEYGTNDDGLEGISRVVQNHICTSLCRHLPPMSLNIVITQPYMSWRLQG